MEGLNPSVMVSDFWFVKTLWLPLWMGKVRHRKVRL
jgi:hypothetical protein